MGVSVVVLVWFGFLARVLTGLAAANANRWHDILHGVVMREKIELMLKVYRERLEKAQRPPIDHVLGMQTEAQISILESLYIYALQEEGRAKNGFAPDGYASLLCENHHLLGCALCEKVGE
jgi:hypothetical protein